MRTKQPSSEVPGSFRQPDAALNVTRRQSVPDVVTDAEPDGRLAHPNVVVTLIVSSVTIRLLLCAPHVVEIGAAGASSTALSRDAATAVLPPCAIVATPITAAATIATSAASAQEFVRCIAKSSLRFGRPFLAG
jgi:hypothetical protein